MQANSEIMMSCSTVQRLCTVPVNHAEDRYCILCSTLTRPYLMAFAVEQFWSHPALLSQIALNTGFEVSISPDFRQLAASQLLGSLNFTQSRKRSTRQTVTHSSFKLAVQCAVSTRSCLKVEIVAMPRAHRLRAKYVLWFFVGMIYFLSDRSAAFLKYSAHFGCVTLKVY
jgi:hypothetical protein